MALRGSRPLLAQLPGPVSRRTRRGRCRPRCLRSRRRSCRRGRCPWRGRSCSGRRDSGCTARSSWSHRSRNRPATMCEERGRARPASHRCVVPRFRRMRRLAASGLSRGFGDDLLGTPDAAVPPGPELRRLAAQDRRGEVGPGTPVPLDRLHQRDRRRRFRRVQEHALKFGTVLRREQRGVGRDRPDDAVSVAARPELVGVRGESRLEPKRLEDRDQIVRVAIADEPAVALPGLQPGVVGSDRLGERGGRSGACGSVPQPIHPRDGKRDGRHQVSM